MVPCLALTRTPSIAPSSAEVTWPVRAAAVWAVAGSSGTNNGADRDKNAATNAAVRRMDVSPTYLAACRHAGGLLSGGEPRPATRWLQDAGSGQAGFERTMPHRMIREEGSSAPKR